MAETGKGLAMRVSKKKKAAADAYGLLENHQLVVDAFGFWPSFHDAEVCWLRLERTMEDLDNSHGPFIEFVIHGWIMTNEVTEDGYYKLINHHLVHFKFEGVYDAEFMGFNHQNAIFSLKIYDEPQTEEEMRHLKVILNGSYGLSGEFKACRGRVMAVTPCGENGNDENKTAEPHAFLPRRNGARPCAGPQEE